MTKAAKPVSKTQDRILRALIKGEHVSLLRGRDTHAYLSPSGETVALPSVWALLDRELIRDTEKKELRWRNSKYRITAKGRQELLRSDMSLLHAARIPKRPRSKR